VSSAPIRPTFGAQQDAPNDGKEGDNLEEELEGLHQDDDDMEEELGEHHAREEEEEEEEEMEEEQQHQKPPHPQPQLHHQQQQQQQQQEEEEEDMEEEEEDMEEEDDETVPAAPAFKRARVWPAAPAASLMPTVGAGGGGGGGGGGGERDMKTHPDCGRLYDAKTYTVQPYPKPNSRQKRSPAWKLCVKLKKGAELKCCYCGHTSKDLSNMKVHLRAVHPYEATMAGLFEVPAETEMGMSSKGKAEPVAWGEGRIDEINRIVALIVVIHGRPLEMVRNEVFVDLCRVLSVGRYSPCCTQTLRKYIDKLYENVLVLGKEKIAGGLHGSFSISVDGWTDVSMDPYCGLVLRFLDKVTLKRCKVLLGCMPW